jgi:hypothetical protein
MVILLENSELQSRESKSLDFLFDDSSIPGGEIS